VRALDIRFLSAFTGQAFVEKDKIKIPRSYGITSADYEFPKNSGCSGSELARRMSEQSLRQHSKRRGTVMALGDDEEDDDDDNNNKIPLIVRK
jgi:hypothetical protein